jgi:hypothetical protein
LDGWEGADFGGGASGRMATFGAFGSVTAACAASSIAVPDFKAMSVQMASGLNMGKGFPDFGSIRSSGMSRRCRKRYAR